MLPGGKIEARRDRAARLAAVGDLGDSVVRKAFRLPVYTALGGPGRYESASPAPSGAPASPAAGGGGGGASSASRKWRVSVLIASRPSARERESW